jgi:hypothetical protein
MKYLVPILLNILSVFILMKCFSLLNVGNTIINLLGVICIFLIVYATIKTKCFLNFKFNKQ